MARAAWLAALLALGAGAGMAAEPVHNDGDDGGVSGGGPKRVVSMNLCTDQLAMMLAAPGQLVSVSHWSAKESASNMVEEARALPLNRGAAEQVFLMRPDLVLAGSFTNHAAVDLLKRLGIRAETIAPARSIEDVPAIIARLGRLLGRDAAAAELTRDFDAELARLKAHAAALPRERAAYHYPNNYTSGAETLADGVMDAAGLDNAAAALGLTGAARLDLERLVMLRPFLIRTAPISGTETGRSYESGRHPALAGLEDAAGGARLAGRLQICGTPFVLEAIEALIEAREEAAAQTLPD